MKRCIGVYVLLLTSRFLTAQNQLADNLAKQFNDYQSNAFQEKLFVHTDKTFYLAGETIWFKIYSVDESFNKPLSVSSIAYVEVIGKDQKPVLQTKISMDAGTGDGYLTLPTSLASGNYLFRAYTSWMKNFPAEFFYEQQIGIVNTLKGFAPNDTLASRTALIRFFPEGGNLVNGLTSKIAFKATGPDGEGISCAGSIVNQQKDTVARFQSLHLGMGNFQLTPKKNEQYYAVVKLNDSLYTQKLPDAYDQGFTLSVSEPEGGKLKITVRATETFFNTAVYLFAQTRNLMKTVQSSQLKDGDAIFYIDKKDLGEGISTFTLFNASRQPVCERLFFKRPGTRLMIRAKSDQTGYAPRKAVNIDLLTSNLSDQPVAANMSLSILLLDSLQHLPADNILSYLYLGSELRGGIESPEYYLNNTSEGSDQAIDNLLLTQGWRRFKWNDLLQNSRPVFEFLPEIEGPIVNGKIVDRRTGLPASKLPAYLTVPGAHFEFSSATSNQEGNLRFSFKDIYKNNEIVLENANRKDSGYRIDIASAYSDKFSSTPVNTLSIRKDPENILLNRSIAAQVENTYRIDQKHRYIPVPENDSTAFYGKPDRLYYLDDYTRFVTMEEVMREYVDDVRVRKDGEKFVFKVRNQLFSTFFDEDPLILLDGIPVTDASRIIALDPLKIKKIEVVTHKFYTGSSIVEGIVSVRSYDGDLGAVQLDPNAIVVEYDGLQQRREFYAPAYATRDQQDSRVPDFRNVLLWSPQVITNSGGRTQVSFFTSDIKGKFAVIVQGISPDGLAGAAWTTFDVTGAE
jgi:hypothetical protein